MADRKYYVVCDYGCKFESMTKEQILTAIMQAVENGEIRDVDIGFVTTIKTVNGKRLKFFFGEQSEYEALTDEEKDDLFAIITNDTSKKALENAIAVLQKNYEALTESLADGSFEVAKAKYATSAGSATNDGAGNNIENTYAKKRSLTDGSLVVKTAECSNAIKGYSFSTVSIDTLDKGYYIGDFLSNAALFIFAFYNVTHGYATTFDFYTKTEGSFEKRISVEFGSAPAVFGYWVKNGQLYIKAISGVSQQTNLQISYIPINI